jgi:DNA-binding SARP family transcriptional activator
MCRVQTIRLRILGDLQIEGVEPSQLGRRQVRTLLKILALGRGRPIGVDRIADCLWGDHPPERPIDQVAVLASRLRGVLGADRVVHNDAGYAVLLDWLDLDAIRDYAAEADRRLAGGTMGAAGTAASAGLSLVRGPLLADEIDAWWADADRAALDLVVSRLHRTAVAAALAVDDWTGAAELSSEMLIADSYDETALRTLMEALARSGRGASALGAYASTRELLADELGVSPSAETEALHTAILIGEYPAARHRSATPDAAIAQLPGRASAIAELDMLAMDAGRGNGRVGVVEGEAGIGKSRLLAAWSDSLTARGMDVVSTTCDELGRSLPLQPLLDALDTMVRAVGPAGSEEILGSDIAVLGPLLVTRTEPTGAAQLAALTDPEAGQALVFTALFSVLRRRSERVPFVLLLDDIHLADAATTAWLGQAARRMSDTRVCIVGARRVEEGVPIPGVTTVTLGRLTFEDTVDVVGAERAADLHVRSGGHPLFLVELASADTQDELPESIRQAVVDRCARAGAAAATLRIAAVIGPGIDLELLSAVTTTGPSELLDHLEEGAKRHLLVEEGQRFVFAHALVREALLASVGAARSAYIHRQAARVLGARTDADPLAAARHARLGGELARASSMLVAAAKVAVRRFDQQEAMRLLDEAVALDDTADARLERARVGSMLARYERASEDIDVARSLGAGPEVLEVAAWSAHFQRQFDRALTFADQGVREGEDGDLRTSCLALGGWVSLASGDLEGAQLRLEGAPGDAPEASGRMAEAWLAWLRMNQGRPAETLRLVRQ